MPGQDKATREMVDLATEYWMRTDPEGYAAEMKRRQEFIASFAAASRYTIADAVKDTLSAKEKAKDDEATYEWAWDMACDGVTCICDDADYENCDHRRARDWLAKNHK